MRAASCEVGLLRIYDEQDNDTFLQLLDVLSELNVVFTFARGFDLSRRVARPPSLHIAHFSPHTSHLSPSAVPLAASFSPRLF